MALPKVCHAMVKVSARPLAKLLSFGGLLMLLAACNTTASEQKPTVITNSPIGAASQSAATPIEPEVPAAPVIDEDPDQLMGMDREALTGFLGPPSLVRREAPAEIWQYSEAGCVFDLFFYEDNGEVRVVYLEARDQAAKRTGTRACLNDILRARQAQSIS